ncbi:MAG TPA: hypothetical protein VMM84_14835 [Pyrinomonadaceae bacterium]|nr:hypothetical protein [Pyrinomonadaceae bacterium]
MIRKYATSKSEPPTNIDGFNEAVSTARELNAEFGGWVGGPWAILEVALTKCKSTSEALQVFSQFPETFTSRKGKKIQLREAAIRYAKALNVVEASYLKNVWPQHHGNVKRAAANITKVFAPKEKECFAYFTKNLGMEDMQSRVAVYLVAESPWPGGFTIRRDNKDGTSQIIVVVSVEAHQGSNLFENLLHEAIHALDMETKGKGNVLIDIHDRLLKAGLTENDQAVRHGAHWLVFIQAGETVRRFLDPTHQHYGKDLYRRLERMSKVDVPAVWIAYLDGKIPRDEAVNEIVDGFLDSHKESSPSKGAQSL